MTDNTVAKRKKFVDTKEIVRSGKSKNDRQYNGQTKKDKQRSTKHYIKY